MGLLQRSNRRLRRTSDRRRKRLRLETLERRLLLATDVCGVINTDTTWNLAGSPYRLTCDVNVRNNALLTIQSGVEVVENSSFTELNFSDNGSGGRIDADGVTFDGDVVFHFGSSGSVDDSTVAPGHFASVLGNADIDFLNTSFSAGNSARVYPEFVPRLVDNSFAPGAVIQIHAGDIDADTVWPKLNDASRYTLIGDVFVKDDATLTVESGMTLFDNNSFVEMRISGDGSGGRLNADGVTLNADVIFGPNATGSILNSSVAGGRIQVTGNATPVFSDTSFHNNSRPIDVYPEYVPEISGRGNTFNSGATIGIIGGEVDRDLQWPNLPGASRFSLLGDVSVVEGATLTVASGMTVFDNLSFVELRIANDASGGALNANGVTFNTDIVFGQNATGTIQDSAVTGGLIQVTVNAAPTFVNTSFFGGGRPINVYPAYVPQLAGRNNTFGNASAIGISGGDIEQDLSWPNLPGASTYTMLGSVRVRNDATLTVGSGMTLLDNLNFVELYIGHDGSGGSLNADNVTFRADVIFGQNSGGNIQNSSVASNLISVLGNASPIFSGTSFPAVRAIDVYPEYVPRLDGRGNEFLSGATIGVLGGVIDQDLVWPKISDASTYVLNNSVSVNNGASLTIGSGMTVLENLNFVELLISNDGQGGTLIADGATFRADVIYGQGGGGLIQDSSFVSRLITVGAGASPVFMGSSFHSGNPINVTPEFLPQLDGKGNQFQSGATIGVLGGIIDEDTVWPNLNDATNYALVNVVQVRDGASLTIEPGVRVVENSNFIELRISPDDSGGVLEADGVNFAADVVFGNRSGGLIQNSSVAARVITVEAGADPDFVATSFHNGVPVSVDPMYLPRLVGNDFNFGATVQVLNGNVSADTTWPSIQGVNQLQLAGAVNVNGGAKLTIADGTVVNATSSFVPLIVQGAIETSFSIINPLLTLGNNSSGVLNSNRYGRDVEIGGSSTVAFSDSDFRARVIGTLNTAGTIDLRDSFWNENDGVKIGDRVIDDDDDARRPDILFQPFVTTPPQKAIPIIRWDQPDPIDYLTPISDLQLNATANVSGTFTYDPPAGTVLLPGVQGLNVTFTPANADTFQVTGSSTQLTVLKADPIVSWPDPDPIQFGQRLSAEQLNATADVPGRFFYDPVADTLLDGGLDQTLSTTFIPDDETLFNRITDTAEIDVLAVTPDITWAAPSDIVFGTPLSVAQLNAEATSPVTGLVVPGSFSYSLVVQGVETEAVDDGAVLDAGTHTLRARFSPSQLNNFVVPPVLDVGINVLKADPVIVWDDPASIRAGTRLSATQLNAVADVPGAFFYEPGIGTQLPFGLDQTLTATFTPNDTTNYNVIVDSAEIDVLRTVPDLDWVNPGAIVFGTPLDLTQLNAEATHPDTGQPLAGTYNYDPAPGTLLEPGNNQVLRVTFVPDEPGLYEEVSGQVAIDVAKADPIITWAAPDPIIVGTAIGSEQLDAIASAPVSLAPLVGTFTYTIDNVPADGSTLGVGTYTIRAAFFPAEGARYNVAVTTRDIVVQRGVVEVDWDTPADIEFGTALGPAQLNAIANSPPHFSNVPGQFAYTVNGLPATGQTLDVGTHTLVATFTPDDSDSFVLPVDPAMVDIEVFKATPVITWPDPPDIFVDERLSAIQLNATADFPGTFTYVPPAGTSLGPGEGQSLSVDFVPDDTANVNEASGLAAISVFRILDYGDAPPSYGVTRASGGPRHEFGTLFLGAAVDREFDGAPSSAADSDDTDPRGDDDDGLAPLADIVATTLSNTGSSFLVTASEAGKLDAWIDFDGDGTFDAISEHLGGGTSIDLVPGDNVIPFDVPAGSQPGNTFVRLRVSTTGGLSPTGILPGGVHPDGEVEDHQISVIDGDSDMTDILVDAPEGAVTLEIANGNYSVVRNGVELFRAPTDTIDSIELSGTDSDDTVTLDFADGNVIPVGGLTIGSGLGRDSIKLEGASSDLDLTDPLLNLSGVDVIDLSSTDASEVVVDMTTIETISDNGTVLVVGDAEDDVTFVSPDTWRMGDPIITPEDTFLRTVVNGNATVQADLPFAFQNLAQRHDVTNDGVVSASDALRIINNLRADRIADPDTRRFVDPRSLQPFPGDYYDVSGDDLFSALDALQVINQLSRIVNSASAEGEADPRATETPDAANRIPEATGIMELTGSADPVETEQGRTDGDRSSAAPVKVEPIPTAGVAASSGAGRPLAKSDSTEVSETTDEIDRLFSDESFLETFRDTSWGVDRA